jgi:hypothetical protein
MVLNHVPVPSFVPTIVYAIAVIATLVVLLRLLVPAVGRL